MSVIQSQCSCICSRVPSTRRQVPDTSEHKCTRLSLINQEMINDKKRIIIIIRGSSLNHLSNGQIRRHVQGKYLFQLYIMHRLAQDICTPGARFIKRHTTSRQARLVVTLGQSLEKGPILCFIRRRKSTTDKIRS